MAEARKLEKLFSLLAYKVCKPRALKARLCFVREYFDFLCQLKRLDH
jgi:hypothetical protein